MKPAVEEPCQTKLPDVVFVAILLAWALTILCLLDDQNVKLEQLARNHGGQTKRVWCDSRYIPFTVPRCKPTAWLYPVTKVDLAGCNVNDGTISRISQLGPGLESMDIKGNPDVTDASIPAIEKMSSLEFVSFDGTSIQQPVLCAGQTKTEYNATVVLVLVLIMLGSVLGVLILVRTSTE